MRPVASRLLIHFWHSAPSVFHLKKAMQTYARQGGSSAIFIHDDGLQLLPEHERDARIAFYADHNIGWVARPAHSSAPDGFKRAGRFKKASNLNYGLALSLRLETHLRALQDAEARGDGIPADGDAPLEDRALHLACDDAFAESGGRWKPWACHGRSIRIGEIILLVDADTVVPEDCLRDAARELAESPEVAIIQHESGKRARVSCRDGSSDGLSQTSCRSRTTILKTGSRTLHAGSTSVSRSAARMAKWPRSSGTMRFCAGRRCKTPRLWTRRMGKRRSGPSRTCPRTLTWRCDFRYGSAVCVLGMWLISGQLKRYIIRWATYSEGGFKEGVSLTVDDELNRWQKYSYGTASVSCNTWVHV